jgi:hypothetical protein
VKFDVIDEVAAAGVTVIGADKDVGTNFPPRLM